jgi:hypothetical protein
LSLAILYIFFRRMWTIEKVYIECRKMEKGSWR